MSDDTDSGIISADEVRSLSVLFEKWNDAPDPRSEVALEARAHYDIEVQNLYNRFVGSALPYQLTLGQFGGIMRTKCKECLKSGTRKFPSVD